MFKNLSLQLRIALVAAIPLIVALCFLGSLVVVKYHEYQEMVRIETLAQLAAHISAYVHETQKERGATGVFMGGQGKKFATELEAQRKQTDSQKVILQEFLNTFDVMVYGDEFNDAFTVATNRMNALDDYRSKANSLLVPAGEVLGLYTMHNAKMLDVINGVSSYGDNAEMTRMSIAYLNFLQGKERAGVERAVMSNTFARGMFGSGVLRKFGMLVNAQSTYFDSFRLSATPEQITYYNQKMSDPVVAEVQRMRDIAFSEGEVKTDGFGVDPGHWLASITKKINLLKDVEDRMANDLNETASQKFGTLELLLNLSADISAFVHETQKERGATGVYAGSGRTKFAAELAEQCKSTNNKKQVLEERLNALVKDGLGDKIIENLNLAVAKLQELNAHRAKVSEGSVLPTEAIGFYTHHNSLMLEVISNIAEITDNGDIRSSLLAYVNFLQGKERAGIERAVMSKTFASNKFDKESLRKFGALVTEQDTYFRVFQSQSTDDQVAFFKETMSDIIVAEVQKMRDIAFNTGLQADGFNVDAGHWFRSITKKINLMKEVEDRISSQLRATATREFGGLATVLELSTKISRLVHETQKERGLTGAYAGSGRRNFAEELADQQTLTDTKRVQFEEFLSSFNRDNLDKQVTAALDIAIAKLNKLNDHRVKVRDGSISAGDSINFYTQHNALMLSVIAHTTEAANDGIIRSDIIAYVNFYKGRNVPELNVLL